MNGTIIDRSSMPVICARVLTCSADEIWFLSKVLYSYVLAFRTLLFDICFCPFLSVTLHNCLATMFLCCQSDTFKI